MKCGDCGEYFGSKVWHSNSKYKRTIWQCSAKFKGGSKCATPNLYEQRIKELFHRLVNYATVYQDGRVVLPSAMAWKLTQEFKESSGQIPGISGYPARCFCVWKYAR